jgi:predicted metal-dependent peptidase
MELTDAQFASIVDEYDKIKAVLVKVSPFLASLTRRIRIVIDDCVPTAGVTQDSTLVINPTFWDRLDFQERCWVIGHEVFHLAFLDHMRQEERDAKRWNITTDGINNKILETMIGIPNKIEEFCVTTKKLWEQCAQKLSKKNIDYQDLDKMSKEELYRIIPWEVVMCDCAGDLRAPTGSGKTVISDKGRGLQDGDKEFYGQEQTIEDTGDFMKKAIADAYVTQKQAGNTPAGLTRAVDQFLNPKVNWRNILRQEMTAGMGRTVVGTYTRLSRKMSGFPGVKKFTTPTVHALIDTSGSIGGDEIQQVLSEIYSIAKTTDVTVECWDAKAYGRIKARNQGQVISKVVGSIKGGGGTVIMPALESVSEVIKPLDLIVVFSDGYIYDIDNQPTKDMLFKLSRRASRCIFAYTSQKHEIPRWKSIEIDIDRK